MNLGDYIEYWYKTYKLPKHAKSTVEVALNHIKTHIQLSELGRMELVNIRTQDIQKFLTELLLYGNKCKLKNMKTYGKPLSHWTVQKIRQLLISAFTQAIREGIILRNHAIESSIIINQTLVIENNEPVLKKRTKTMRSLYKHLEVGLDLMYYSIFMPIQFKNHIKKLLINYIKI